MGAAAAMVAAGADNPNSKPIGEWSRGCGGAAAGAGATPSLAKTKKPK